MSSEFFFIINPNSHGEKTGKNLKKILRKIKDYIGDFSYELTKGPRDEVNIAKKAIEEGYKTIVALGGDGTATNVGDVIVEHPGVKLGLVSAGSMCDWHRTHSIPYELDSGLAILTEGYSEKFPAMRCKGEKNYYSFDMADGGFSGKAAAAAFYELKWLKIGIIKYNYLAVKYLFKTPNVPATITIDDNEPIEIKELTNVMVALGDDIVGFKVLPGNPYFVQKYQDLGIVIAHGMKGLKRLLMLLRASNAKHVGMKGVWLTRGRKIRVVTHKEPLCWEAEGEIFNETGSEVVIERVENAIELIVPKDREYPDYYNEEIYYEKFEDSFRKRKLQVKVKH